MADLSATTKIKNSHYYGLLDRVSYKYMNKEKNMSTDRYIYFLRIWAGKDV